MISYFVIKNWLSNWLQRRQAERLAQKRAEQNREIVYEIVEMEPKCYTKRKKQHLVYRKADEAYFRVRVDRMKGNPFFPLFYNRFQQENTKIQAQYLKKKAEKEKKQFGKLVESEIQGHEQTSIISISPINPPKKCDVCQNNLGKQTYTQHIRGDYHIRNIHLRTPVNVWICELYRKYRPENRRRANKKIEEDEDDWEAIAREMKERDEGVEGIEKVEMKEEGGKKSSKRKIIRKNEKI